MIVNTQRSDDGDRRLFSSGRGEAGFSLIELMITVVIIAILAAVAIPSYMDSVWKGRRAEAKAAMLKALQSEERYYTQNNTYVDANTLAAAVRGAFPAYSADTSANSHYAITYVRAGANGTCTDNDFAKCVIVTATVVGAPDPKCGSSLSIDSVGNKVSATGDPVCWK